MSPDSSDPTYVWDILDAARQIAVFVDDVSLEAYEQDRKLQLAVERLLEIIGEASRRLSPAFREEHDHLPWSRMIGLRNVIAHEYGEVRNDLVWRVARHRIPELVRALEAIEGL